FTSEAKEAVAHYDELLEEMTLALKECGRKLASHVRAHKHAQREQMRRSLFEKYIPEVAQSLSEILGVPRDKTEKSFYKALPSFVTLADDPPAPKEAEAAHDRAAPSMPPPADSSPPPPPAPGKTGAGKGKARAEVPIGQTKTKGKGKQLSLLE
ncbi:MAG: hypothetical protein ACRELB_12665, partial [Polyangiaceae bacterium]